MNSPWIAAPALEGDALRSVLRRAIFECCKWDPQVGDVSVLAPFPLVLAAAAWAELSRHAEALAAECLAAETELLGRPDLWPDLALPRALRSALLHAGRGAPASAGPRVVRFDFHHTPEGWKISEANADAPGGYNEASGLAALVRAHYPQFALCGDPAGALARAAMEATGPGARVALAHATAYADDRQVIEYLARRLAEAGLDALPLSPDHLRWSDGAARVETEWFRGPADLVFRFFPAEWLPNLPRACGWPNLVRGGRTPVVNPGSSVLVQSKRFPLAWDRLKTPLPAWRALLPRTVDPRDAEAPDSGAWVFKPAFGRVGEDVAIAGVIPSRDWEKIRRLCRRRPGLWAAQRRFEALPWVLRGEALYPCVGVYTVDGKAAGAYGRVATRPLTDERSMEAAVLVEA